MRHQSRNQENDGLKVDVSCEFGVRTRSCEAEITSNLIESVANFLPAAAGASPVTVEWYCQVHTNLCQYQDEGMVHMGYGRVCTNAQPKMIGGRNIEPASMFAYLGAAMVLLY